MEDRPVARREFLVLGGALAVGRAAPAANGHLPLSQPTFVLVHGAWHGATCWTDVANELRLDGFRVLAVDLPGHGIHARYPTSYFSEGQTGFGTERSPLADVTLDEAARTVISALDRAQGRVKPILVGHSMGGTVITRAAELAPQLIGRLVYRKSASCRSPWPCRLIYRFGCGRRNPDHPPHVGEASNAPTFVARKIAPLPRHCN